LGLPDLYLLVSIRKKLRKTQCWGSGINIPDPNFSIPDPNFSIPDPNFSIPDPGSKRLRITDPDPYQIVHKLSEIRSGMFIPDHGSGS
jgi:hypothetical protein